MTRMTVDQAILHGLELHKRGDLAGAEGVYRSVLKVTGHPDALNLLGTLCHRTGRWDEGIGLMRRAVAAVPNSAGYLNNLALALHDRGELGEAHRCLKAALRVSPEDPAARANLARLLKDEAKIEEAVEQYRRAVASAPERAEIHGAMLYCLNFHPGYDARAILMEHRAWASKFADPLGVDAPAHTNGRDPDRPLKVGFVSPDFYGHPVGRFILPVLATLDKERYRAYCYSDVRVEDKVTEETRRHVTYVPVAGMTDAGVAERVRADGIDVLFDLTLHMEYNRLLAFARRPAPVQVTYLGYPGTTGMAAMGWRLTDAHVDPPGTEGDSAERSYRLAGSYWCYRPVGGEPEVGPLPADRNGYVTFGSFNNASKVTGPVIDAWSRVMRELPTSRMVLLVNGKERTAAVVERFARQGVDARRLTFRPPLKHLDYMAAYGTVDLAMDPFPYPGHTTACDGLYMGVPAVTIAGGTSVSRGAASVLNNVGLGELVTTDLEGYVARAAGLARDVGRLRELRAGVRGRMCASALMDAARVTREIEEACRFMWREWCVGATRPR